MFRFLARNVDCAWKVRDSPSNMVFATILNEIAMDDRATPSLPLVEFFTKPRPSLAERIAEGRARRTVCPRSSLATYEQRPERLDPVEVIQRQNGTRLPALVPVRIGRMLASPFSFLRGSAEIMAADLAYSSRCGIEVMACGDMHISNFGLFASAERNLIFAINDFDEVHPGPWEWDLKRLAASAAVAADHLGGSRAHAEEAAWNIADAYANSIRRYSQMGQLEVWYDRIDEQRVLKSLPEEFRPEATRIMDRARSRGHIRSLERLTEEIDGSPRLIEQHPIIIHETHLADGTPVQVALDRMLESYLDSLNPDRRHLLQRYRIVDVVRKVVGVGSVGTSCWVLLLQGENDRDPLFLQVKEARPSVLSQHWPRPVPIVNEGERVVVGQRMIQGSPDIFLGWGPGRERKEGHFYVRQLADMKGGPEFSGSNRKGIAGLYAYARLCGLALALAHAKSGEAAAITGYCGQSDAVPDAVARFANAYREQNQRDHDALAAAVRQGRLPAVYGV